MQRVKQTVALIWLYKGLLFISDSKNGDALCSICVTVVGEVQDLIANMSTVSCFYLFLIR